MIFMRKNNTRIRNADKAREFFGIFFHLFSYIIFYIIPGYSLDANSIFIDFGNSPKKHIVRELKRYLSEAYEVTVVCSGEERYKNIQEFLERIYMTGRVKLKEGTLTQGLDIPDMKVAYITDKDIFGTYKLKRRKTTTKKDSKYESAPIKSFAEIRTGDFVVHENHGIGKFEGMVQMEVQGEKRDYLKVKYAGEDYLYVPAEQMSLIQRYISPSSTPR